MKKLILSSLAMALMAFAANAVTYMCVKTTDGMVVKHDVENVTEVYYEKTDAITDQGVSVSGKEGIYNYVDLGLESGTKWATCNVGATKPTEYGTLFTWGETTPNKGYTNTTYKWCTRNSDGVYNFYTKYCTDSEYGTVDNKTVLEAEDDAATANWGSAWRMPTTEEQKELLEGCDWKWVEDFNGSGVNGRLGTSKKNGTTIFLPAAGLFIGHLSGVDFYDIGDCGYYWSSSLSEGFTDEACFLYFTCGSRDLRSIDRCDGLRVRAVFR